MSQRVMDMVAKIKVNLQSEIDWERGKFLGLMSTTEKENLSRMCFPLVLGADMLTPHLNPASV